MQQKNVGNALGKDADAVFWNEVFIIIQAIKWIELHFTPQIR